MYKKLLITLLIACSAWVASAQELYFDGEVSTHFDNTEHTGSDVGESRTIFAVRVTPALGYRWNGKHSVVVGAELLKDFGSSRFIDEADFVAYYQFSNNRFGANAGIFPREKLVGHYSRAFFSDSYLIYHNLVQGIALRYTGRNSSFAELAVDWEGLYSPDTREKFRVLVAGGGEFADIFYAGGALSLQHFANKSTFYGNVVDNVLVNPYIGVKFNAYFDFDIRLGGLVSLQRDRKVEGGGWLIPAGGEFYFRMSRWGVFIDNNLYVGANLMPLFDSVGNDGEPYAGNLYAADPFYGTRHKIYNRTGIGYERAFVKDHIKVRAEIALQYNGQRMYCQQLIGLSATICPTIYNKANHKK